VCINSVQYTLWLAPCALPRRLLLRQLRAQVLGGGHGVGGPRRGLARVQDARLALRGVGAAVGAPLPLFAVRSPRRWVGAAPKHQLVHLLKFTSSVLWESIILLCPPPHLRNLPYCNSIARPLRNTRLPTDPPVVCHTLYNIGDGNIV